MRIGVGGFGYWQDVPYLIEDHCNDDQIASDVFSAASIAARRAEITASIVDIRSVMSAAGYTDADWTLVVDTYPSPIPNGDGFAFWETGYNRFDEGCGFWDEDADWANSVALPTINQTVRGRARHRGAEHRRDGHLRGVQRSASVRRGHRQGPRRPGFVDVAVRRRRRRIRVGKGDPWNPDGGKFDVPPFQQQESFHPNYWGQLALRNYTRQAYNNGSPVGGECVRDANGLNSFGEPNMRLEPAANG